MVITFNPPILREFVEPNESDAFIWWLFKRRCVMCRQSATEINEIVPRARSKKSIHDWRNRVTLCQTCHRKYHDGGVTDAKMDDMKTKRSEFLTSVDRTEYVQ